MALRASNSPDMTSYPDWWYLVPAFMITDYLGLATLIVLYCYEPDEVALILQRNLQLAAFAMAPTVLATIRLPFVMMWWYEPRCNGSIPARLRHSSCARIFFALLFPLASAMVSVMSAALAMAIFSNVAMHVFILYLATCHCALFFVSTTMLTELYFPVKLDPSDPWNRVVYNTGKVSASPASDTCCICLSEFRPGEELAEVICGHLYHTQCIASWWKTKAECPMRCSLTKIGMSPV